MIAVRPILSPSPLANCCYDTFSVASKSESKINPAKRQYCCDYAERVDPAKKRKVKFSEFSSCQVSSAVETPEESQVHEFEDADQQHSIHSLQDDKTKPELGFKEPSAAETSPKTVDAPLQLPFSAPAKMPPTPEPAQTTTNCKPPPEPSTDTIPTKLTDGPSLVTLTTHNLITRLLKQGKISKREVLDTLQTSPPPCPAAAIGGAENNLPDPPGSTATQPTAASAAVRCLLDPALCTQVHQRLQLLCDRIASSGRAPLLPSTSVMAPPFLPALRFLVSATADVLRSIELSRLEEE
uniref:Uncharacterized protein n=1 Tax=Cryptomonas curvata TaxID=233186 RepID=A0A7S0QM84_9CRYP|mmetsp:Transcript_51339/g.107221  ORF Transcript_51339/g.107221 Transcript_51339/m.107221 type:complete len:296 (+) Transcript_51339:199-1086(+)